MEIPKAVQDQIDFLKKTVESLIGKVDANTQKSVREQSAERLAAIQKKAIFQGLGEPIPNKTGVGNYPFALYKKSTRMVQVVDKDGKLVFDANMEPKMAGALDKRGDPLVDVCHVMSDDERDQKLAEGWFVNPLGIAEKRGK